MSKKIQIALYSIIIVLSLTTAAALFLMTPRSPIVLRYDNVNPRQIRTNLPETNQTTTRLCETPKENADEYFKNVYFVGDSRTHALTLYGVPKDHVFAEDGLNHERALTEPCVPLSNNKLATIPDAVMVTSPKIMIVNFGINGAAYMGKDKFMEGYEKLIDTLIEKSPNSILVVESILPVSAEYEQREDGCSNVKIDELNDAIYQMAQKKGLFYLGTNEVMKDKNNELKSEYNKDGLHYNEAGCDAILNYALTHAVIIR